MPTYLYECPKHGEIQIHHLMSETATKCPILLIQGFRTRCGKRLTKVFSATPTHFKGDGFYKTDNTSGASAKKRSD